MSIRIETDLLGKVTVPAEALYGAQTQRALENYPVGQYRTFGSYHPLVRAMVYIKKAAAITNRNIGALPAPHAEALVAACDDLLQQAPAALQPLFPVHALHGGGGTSANMNINEVLANLAEERLGGQRGAYQYLHPNDHVNLHQSTNDVYPTACHMAIIMQWPGLRDALSRLIEAFNAKSLEFSSARRIARTCFQDAVDITFFDFFQGYTSFLTRGLQRLEEAVDRLHAVNLGGTIVGRAEDVPEAYLRQIVLSLRAVTRDADYHPAANLFDAAQNADDVVNVSGQLDLLARGLIKIAQDLRILGSGPETGLAELILPAVQPGSSIMPGKVNPSIPEFVIQAAFKVMGNHVACAAGLNHAELDLNVWESSMVVSVLNSLELLESALTAFTDRCVLGLRINAELNARHADTIIPLLTRLGRQHGYSTVTAVYKEAQGDMDRLRGLLRAQFGEVATDGERM